MNKRVEGNEEFLTEKAKLLPLGAWKSGNDTVISLPTTEKIDKVQLYKKSTGKACGYAKVTDEYKRADIYSFKIKKAAGYDYSIIADRKSIRDGYAKVVVSKMAAGREKTKIYGVYRDNFNWEDDKNPNHSYEDSFIYRLHVKGFTRHISSKVKNKGTFAGIIEKIDYLKELGVTAVELMPAYEFDEELIENGKPVSGKTNYWGYANAHYFAPKESYSSKKGGGQVNEFKNMVKQLHLAGIEVIMDFYFVPKTNPYLIIDCLRHWVLEYHIDGIHVNMEVAPVSMIKEDPVLSLVKIFADSWEVAEHFETNGQSRDKKIAIFNDDFMINIRRFIKSDEEQLYGVASKLKRNPANCGIINYLANHYTFTLMDAVSYEKKHNEQNGEGNQDGTDYNYSWNCGVEGPTKRKKIKELRIKQIKNALTLLFFSQGTPMLYAGDEMGKTQLGNNNPYCQDNEISWINWNNLRTNVEIFEYVKALSRYRKEHKILHMKEEPRNIDYLSIGIPDISYHGIEPWRADFSYGNRQLAILYGGEYSGGENTSNIYIAFNMYWEEAKFYIPQINISGRWEIRLVTDSKAQGSINVEKRSLVVPPRSIVVLEEIKDDI